jgi:hypothetical protein
VERSLRYIVVKIKPTPHHIENIKDLLLQRPVPKNVQESIIQIDKIKIIMPKSNRKKNESSNICKSKHRRTRRR